MCELHSFAQALIHITSAGFFGLLAFIVTTKIKQNRQTKKVEVQDNA